MRSLRVVVKIGGSLAVDMSALDGFAAAVASLAEQGVQVCVVHGGGKDISSNLALLSEKPVFLDGLRVTTDTGMRMVEMTLSGQVNKMLVRLLAKHGGRAVGISGVDGGLLLAKQVARVELGRVGDIVSVDPKLVRDLWAANWIPVVSPVAQGVDGAPFNINADTAASEVAVALAADQFLLVSDVHGVLDADKRTIPELDEARVESLVAQGVITGGMIPKTRGAMDSIRRGLKAIHIVGWKSPEAFMDQILGKANHGTILH